MSLIDGLSFDKKGLILLKENVTAIQSLGKIEDKGNYVIIAYEGGIVFSYNMSE